MSKPTAAQIAQEDALVAVIDSSRRIHKDDVDEKSILATVNEYRSYRLDLSKCFTCKPEPLDFVLAGLKAGTVGALIGTGGVSKSMMAIIEGIHVASGADLLATGAVPKGNVAILALEDDEQSIHHRLHAIGKHLTPSQIKEAATNLHIYPCTLSIMSLEGAVAQALAKDCRLLIVDTLRRAHDRDENDTKEMSQVLSLMEAVAKKSGAAVLFVHHQGKAAITGGTASEATSARGATVLIDNSRFCMALSNIHEKECGKSDYGYRAWERLLTMSNLEGDVDQSTKLAEAQKSKSCAVSEEQKTAETL